MFISLLKIVYCWNKMSVKKKKNRIVVLKLKNLVEAHIN